MLLFRTILLWLSFVLLILQYFISFDLDLEIVIFINMLPSGILILWFLLSIFVKEKLVLKLDEIPSRTRTIIQILRPMASITIILGALLKLIKLYNGNEFLVIGIGFMAIYSSFLYFYAIDKQNRPNDIIDDVDES